MCCDTFCCAIDVNVFSPTSFAVSTFTLIPALILRKRQLLLNGFRDSRNSNSSHESVIYFPCLAVVKSLCRSLVLYCTPVSCCIALFTSAQTGCAINQTRRWVSVMPRPLVYIIVCHAVLQISIFRSSSQDLVAASGQRRPAKPSGALYVIQSTTTCCTYCVVCPQAQWPTLEHPRVSTCRQHAQCHIAGDSVSPTACGVDLPQEVSQV